MIEKLIAAPPLTPISSQAFLQEIAAELGDSSRNKRQLARKPDSTQRLETVIFPRWLSGEHLDDRTAERPHVTLRSLIISPDNLRSHPERAATRRDRNRRILQLDRRSEVRQLNGPSAVSDEDVLRFHVAVDDSVRVNVTESGDEAPNVTAEERFVNDGSTVSHVTFV
ncbi:hypothetical protein YC2023_054843 [Brassica napus]